MTIYHQINAAGLSLITLYVGGLSFRIAIDKIDAVRCVRAFGETVAPAVGRFKRAPVVHVTACNIIIILYGIRFLHSEGKAEITRVVFFLTRNRNATLKEYANGFRRSINLRLETRMKSRFVS